MNDRIVVDASAAGALFFREPEAPKIEKAIQGHVCLAPRLIDYEMGSIYLKKLKLHPGKKEALQDCFDLFLSFPMDKMDVPMDVVATLALKLRVTIYDGSYLWLAKEVDAEFVTLDEKLRKVKLR